MLKKYLMSVNLLIFIMIFSLYLYSCSNTADNTNSNNTGGIAETTEDNISETEAAATTLNHDKSDLPDTYDLDGYIFRVLQQDFAPATYLGYNLVAPDEMTGDILYDAIYERNLDLMEKYNFSFKITYTGTTDPINTVKNSVLANDDVTDIALVLRNTAMANIKNQYFIDINTVPNIDLTKNYYDQSMVKDLSFNNKMYAVQGDILLGDDDALMMTMYNRSLAEDYDIENLYEVAYAGNFTFDVMLDNMKKVITDLNGDGVIDKNDRIGLLYADNSSYAPYMGSSDIYFVEKDENDIPQLVSDTTRAVQVFEKVAEMITTPGYAVNWITFGNGTQQIPVIVSMIDNKQVLFQNMILSQVRRFFRDITTDFGLLPMAKLTETQDTYSTIQNNVYDLLVIPVTNGDLEKTGFVIEAMSAASYDITDLYYNVCLESKYTRDIESFDMINLAKEKIVSDMAFIYGWGGLTTALNTAVQKGGDLFTSIYAANEAKLIAEMQTFVDME